MNIRSQLIRLAAAGLFAVATAAAFTTPASAATVTDYTGFDQDGNSSFIDTIVTGSNAVLISMKFLPRVVATPPDGGVYGTISVDVGAPPVTFVADGFPYADPTDLEVGLFPGTGIFTALLAANGSYDIYIKANLLLLDASYIDDRGPILEITTEEVANAVPVPGALPLFATGIGALGFMQWRRRRRAQAA